MPTAASVILAYTVPEHLWGTRSHTYSGEVQQGREEDCPGVHGVHNVATVELEAKHMLDIRVRGLNTKHTNRPSTSRLFRRNIIVEMMPVAVE